ncbi:hypothetical protein FRB96_008136 [Tulasnella sp. 330]|nr:hypothetical protein FRB96_008136 [Tulasnella sp. 330]KAG8877050.1 hypothetical protein FRB97_003764 [Tulasnella sp. 331]
MSTTTVTALTSSADQSLSLPALFSRALESASNAYHLSSIEDETQVLLQSSISDLKSISYRIKTLSLFSENETLEEVATKDLVYLFVSYALGEALGRARAVGVDERMSKLLESQTQFQVFVRLLENYEVLPEEERKLYRRTGASSGGTTLSDAAQRRETKINQYKKEKELRAKALRARRGQADIDSPNDFDLIASLLSKPSTKVKVGRGNHDTQDQGEDDDNEDDEDEDAAREITLVLLRLIWTQALSQLGSMRQEIDLLQSTPREDFGPPMNLNDGRDRDATVDRTWQLDRVSVAGGPDGRGPLMDKEGRPLRPFTILPSGAAAERARFQSEVFRPDHRLPTMTMDEYLEEERKRGKFINGGGAASQEAPTTSEQLTMDSEQDGTMFAEERGEEKRLKDEKWAQFTDANPKGSGNTMNRG